MAAIHFACGSFDEYARLLAWPRPSGLVLAWLTLLAVACRALDLNRFTRDRDCGAKQHFAQGYAEMAAQLLHSNDLVKAEQAFRCALAIHPDRSNVRNDLGNLLKSSGRLREARECYSKVLELQPNFAVAWNNLGCVDLDDGRFGQSRCLRDLPLPLLLGGAVCNDVTLFLRNVNVWSASPGQPQMALQRFTKAVYYDPKLGCVHSNLLSILGPESAAAALANVANVLRDEGTRGRVDWRAEKASS